MVIKYLSKEDINSFLSFNKRMYPARKGLTESIYFKLNHPYLTSFKDYPTLIAFQNGEIIGQIQRIPCKYYYKGEVGEAFWGMDYIVDENHRGSAGFLLAKNALKDKHFGMGLSERSYKIHILLGESLVGKYKKFIFFKSPWHILKFIFALLGFQPYRKNKKYINKIKTIRVKNLKFTLVNDYRNLNFGTFNGDIIEFIRDPEFMQWRFGSYNNTYSTYILQDNSEIKCYFVLRLVYWKSSPFILLVDYRYTPGYFKYVIKAVKKILKFEPYYGIITMSTLSELDKELHKALFIKFGHIGQIVTNIRHNFTSNDIDDRNAIMLTFADSDADFFYGDKIWFE